MVAEELSADTSLSPLFHVRDARLSEPVHRYVIDRRVQRARLLILEGRSSLAEIAATTGFAHRAHMSRWLKRVFAMHAWDLARLGLG